jgi:hypothetical protein
LQLLQPTHLKAKKTVKNSFAYPMDYYFTSLALTETSNTK